MTDLSNQKEWNSMKYDKVKALLSLKGKNFSDYADYMNVSKQQISNKKTQILSEQMNLSK